MSAHTPTPWSAFIGHTTVAIYSGFPDTGRSRVCDWPGFEGAGIDIETSKANAAFIVLACNSHAKLLAALEEALEYFEDREDVRDGPNGEPLPNAEMSMAQVMRAALDKGRGAV